jgi:hypothetical protein
MNGKCSWGSGASSSIDELGGWCRRHPFFATRVYKTTVISYNGRVEADYDGVIVSTLRTQQRNVFLISTVATRSDGVVVSGQVDRSPTECLPFACAASNLLELHTAVKQQGPSKVL